MVDFIKIQCTLVNIDRIIENHINVIKGLHQIKTGELRFPYKFKFEEYRITINYSPKTAYYYLEIAGSLHKNHHAFGNFERFTFDMVKEEIEMLCEVFDLLPERMVIKNLEFGVNIVTPFIPIELLEQNLLLYKTQTFNSYDRGSNGKRIGYYCDGTPTLKVYDKGLQYDLPYNLMRVELRYRKARAINTLGVFTAKDLLNESVAKVLGNRLLEAWDRVLLYEADFDASDPTIPEPERLFYQACEYPKNWLKDITTQTNRTKFYRRKERFRSFIRKYGQGLHSIIRNLVKEEVQSCLLDPVEME